jgi:hypothetical protein
VPWCSYFVAQAGSFFAPTIDSLRIAAELEKWMCDEKIGIAP